MITEKIKNDYPLVYDGLEKRYHRFIIDNETDTRLIFCSKGEFCIFAGDDIIIPFNMLVGLLIDFFDENGIFIGIEPSYKKQFNIEIVQKEESVFIASFNTRKQALENAILKACEILQKRLSEVKK